jgi:hypothetical protein
MLRRQSLQRGQSLFRGKPLFGRQPVQRRQSLRGRGEVMDAARQQAAREALYCERVLAKSGSSVVAAVLGGASPLTAMTHYPPGDIFDPDSGAQAYYHAHGDGTVGDGAGEEHGHFHCFLRPDGLQGPIHHLVALGINRSGQLVRLFTVNRWVTGDDWRSAEELIALLPRFDLQMAKPDYLANRWLTAAVALYRGEIAALLTERDRAIDTTRLEDRVLEVLSSRVVDLTATARDLRL